MEQAERLRQELRKLLKGDFSAKAATVFSVDRSDQSIDVRPADGGADILNVRLQAALDQQELGVIIFPKVGSEVVVMAINDNWNSAFVVATTEIDQVMVTIEKVQMSLTKEGLLLKRENETLRGLVGDLIGVIGALTWRTNYGPTIGLVPTSQQALNNLKTRFESLLNGT